MVEEHRTNQWRRGGEGFYSGEERKPTLEPSTTYLFPQVRRLGATPACLCHTTCQFYT